MGRLVSLEVLLEYLRKQPTQQLHIIMDGETGEGVEVHQEGNEPPTSERFSDKSKERNN